LNPGPRLARCVASVAAQTYPHVEHVVVDGASGDGTVELLEVTPGIRWVSEPDDGQSAAINKGFALARGELLTWLNADDVLVPRALELAVEALESEPGTELAYGDCEVVESGRRVTVWRPGRVFSARNLEAGELIPQAGMLVARSALDRVGPLDERLQLTMDVDLWLRLADAGVRAAYIPQTLAVFELHGGSKSGSVDRARFFEEQARVLVKNGRARGAALALGRAAAYAALAGGRVDRRRLEQEVERRVEGADRAVLHAAALAEAAVLETRASARGVRYLLASEPWRLPETRARLLAGVRRRLRDTIARRQDAPPST
jgi:glycosyltransferase involved in cell wall biosynthesis